MFEKKCLSKCVRSPMFGKNVRGKMLWEKASDLREWKNVLEKCSRKTHLGFSQIIMMQHVTSASLRKGISTGRTNRYAHCCPAGQLELAEVFRLTQGCVQTGSLRFRLPRVFIAPEREPPIDVEIDAQCNPTRVRRLSSKKRISEWRRG